MPRGSSVARDTSVQVVAKVDAVLVNLAEDGETTAADLADRVGEPRSTVYRLLSTLQRLDMVEPGSRRGTYRLGLKLLRLGSAVVARFDERQAALPVMERIHEETGETVFLCIRRGFEAVCIERLDGRRVQSLALRLGGSLPLHAGAAPRVLLAYEPEALWEEYLDTGPLERMTATTPTRRRELVERLEEIRRDGYAVSDEDVTVGMAAVGAPIFDHRGGVRAALSISGVRPAILGERAAEMTALVVEGAREVSRALGHVDHEARLRD
jgi:DNA-binding IclR family transcriptional regulator